MPDSTRKEISFEDAIEHLENLIETMESGETPLAELVDKFEQGTRLLKTCQKQLRKAELKIEKLNVDSGELEPFEESSTAND